MYRRLDNVRTDWINKCVSELARTKPAWITIEDLNVSGMMKNRHLAKAIQDQKLREFRDRLVSKAKALGIEVRVVSRWYPSSKTCHSCGFIKHGLTLKDRVFNCPRCHASMDRDWNAALNLRDATDYKIA